MEWLDRQFTRDLFISTITLAEIRLGIALLANGKRKRLLTQAATETLQEFSSTTLNFDEKSAELYAIIVVECTKSGRPISVEDAQIAAISIANKLTLVTRNVADFEVIGNIEIFNPFE